MLKILLNSLFLLYNTSRGELFMKKKLLFVFLMILLILPINVFADTIKKLDMKIYLDNKKRNVTINAEIEYGFKDEYIGSGIFLR